MIDYLTHYYKKGTPPFRSLPLLSEAEAIPIMEALCDDTGFDSRFKDPAGYLHRRRATEHWVREQFSARGGCPLESHPVYAVLGGSRWITRQVDMTQHAEIRIPLSIFQESDVSFTYPDSMLSLWFGTDKPAAYYLPEYHGKIFIRSEILSIVEKKGMPEETWRTNLPDDLAPYIEAQIWNREPLQNLISTMNPKKMPE